MWKPADGKPEIAGHLLLATRQSANGDEDFIRFSKEPMEIVLARRNDRGWQFEVPAFNKSFSGRGRPPRRILWFHLAEAVFRDAPAHPWTWTDSESNRWTFVNAATGARLEGFFEP